MPQTASATPLRRLCKALGIIFDRIPRHLPITIARRLMTQANAARDAHLYEVAAALLEEALRFTPNKPRLHIQCGHMFKEARDFASAESHYEEALRLMPGNVELMLQLGHFYKVADRPEEAEAAYGRALELRPDWTEAAEELARVRASGANASEEIEGIVPELLSRSTARCLLTGEAIRISRSGATRVGSRGGMLKVARGVEAIRGYCISSAAIDEVQILIDSVPMHSSALAPAEDIGADGPSRKYVFNIWHDFAPVELGRREITLRFLAAGHEVLSHKEKVTVTAPHSARQAANSDAVAFTDPLDPRPVEKQINAAPSMIRSVRRSPLPDAIQTILVQRADQLGDLACSVPAIRRLREIFPTARLIGLLTSANAALGFTLGLFDDIIVAEFAELPPERRRTMSAEAQKALRKQLGAFEIDLAIDLSENSESRPLLLLSGARFLYGFKDRESPWLSAGFEMNARDPVNGLEVTPPSRKMLAMIETLGAMQRAAASWPCPDLSRDRLAHFHIDESRPFILLHTGARLAYSRWPGFPELVHLILARSVADIVILVDDPAEAARFAPSARIKIVEGHLPFDDFDALISFCAAFIGNDSGPKHLAALRGTNVVSLHMARLNWNEWGQEIAGTIISRRVPCAGCAISHNAEECGKDFACIRHIRPEEVFGAVRDLLDMQTVSA